MVVELVVGTSESNGRVWVGFCGSRGRVRWGWLEKDLRLQHVLLHLSFEAPASINPPCIIMIIMTMVINFISSQNKN